MPTFILPKGRHSNLSFSLRKQAVVSVRVVAAEAVMAYVVTDHDYQEFLDTGEINYVVGHARTREREFEKTLPPGKYHVLTVNDGTGNVPVFCELTIG